MGSWENIFPQLGKKHSAVSLIKSLLPSNVIMMMFVLFLCYNAVPFPDSLSSDLLQFLQIDAVLKPLKSFVV